eukprot:4426396-Pyramimonas_sp.AAC.1
MSLMVLAVPAGMLRHLPGRPDQRTQAITMHFFRLCAFFLLMGCGGSGGMGPSVQPIPPSMQQLTIRVEPLNVRLQ